MGLSMDDEQLAARRAEIPVHCAACGGEFPGTTELHNGICDTCQKLTHGPNYRLIAELNRKSEELERLRKRCDQYHNALLIACAHDAVEAGRCLTEALDG